MHHSDNILVGKWGSAFHSLSVPMGHITSQLVDKFYAFHICGELIRNGMHVIISFTRNQIIS